MVCLPTAATRSEFSFDCCRNVAIAKPDRSTAKRPLGKGSRRTHDGVSGRQSIGSSRFAPGDSTDNPSGYCAVRETLANHASLRSLLGLRDDADLLEALASERRILILEAGERIFLRTVDGFAVVHHLMHLIHRTAATTLWLIVMNDRSFRVLDAATHLHRVFSHRINAMSVSRSDLETAILERHRLSGLRLEFAPPPAGDPRVNRAK
jgi:hypothetical protein